MVLLQASKISFFVLCFCKVVLQKIYTQFYYQQTKVKRNRNDNNNRKDDKRVIWKIFDIYERKVNNQQTLMGKLERSFKENVPQMFFQRRTSLKASYDL